MYDLTAFGIQIFLDPSPLLPKLLSQIDKERNCPVECEFVHPRPRFCPAIYYTCEITVPPLKQMRMSGH